MTAGRMGGNEWGYTLLEMMVALSLTGVLSTALVGNVGLGARVWEVTETQSHNMALSSVLEKTLRHQLSLAAAVTVTTERGQGQIFFEGDSKRLRFVTEAGAGAFSRGLYGVTLSLQGPEHAGGDPVLIFGRARTALGRVNRDAIPAWDESVLPLVAGAAENARLAYFGRQDADREPHWHSAWSGQRKLPMLVKLSFGDDQQEQSARDIVVALATDISIVNLSSQTIESHFSGAGQ